MGEVKWIKLYPKMFRTSRKISAIEQMKNGDAIVVIWLKLLCLAGEINDGGTIYVTPQIPFDSTSLAYELRRPRPAVDKALQVFEEHGMIFRDDAGYIQIVNWEKYQSVDKMEEIRAKDRERKRRKRETEKGGDNSANNPRKFHGNSTEVPSIEEEREEEKESHSFDLSRASEQENNVTDKDRAKRELMGGELGGGVVMISGEEFDKLLDELSLDELTHYIGVVRDCELNGRKFKRKTHYQAIMEMAMADRMKAVKSKKQAGPKAPANSSFDTDDLFMENLKATFGEDFDMDTLKNN